MSRFTYVEVWPPTGHPDRLFGWPDSEPIEDAFLRASRPVTELYSEALPGAGVTGHKSMLRLSCRASDNTEGEVRVTVWRRKPYDLPGEMGFIHLPRTVGRLTPTARAELVLESVHAAVLLLADHRGWDPAAFEVCREHVVDHEFTYRWASPWKSSPDRRHRARALFRLGADDGFGRVRLEIADRSGDVVARSDEAIAFCTSAGLRRSANTLRWHGAAEVALLPYGGLGPGDASGLLRAIAEDQGWLVERRDDVTVRQPGGDGLAPVEGAPLPPVVTVRD